ncbi:MAG: hypothetical protein Q8K65_03920 [Alphaproteobacteria bacterium]|nr:hypothetical protein [Alphaproteobacteria bacterium]
MDFKKHTCLETFAKAAKKVTLIAALAIGTTGCMTTGSFMSGTYPAGSQYGNPTLGQGSFNQGVPRGYQISYQAPRAPWATDPTFQREVSISLQQANNSVRMQYATFQSSVANCNASYAYAIQANNQQMQYARQNGVSWTEAANSGARINSANASLNYCRVSAETTFQSNHLYQQQAFDNNLENLNRKYAQRYGVKW